MTEQPEPAEGQVWLDNDKRGPGREVDIVSVSERWVVVKNVRHSRINRKRFPRAFTYLRG